MSVVGDLNSKRLTNTSLDFSFKSVEEDELIHLKAKVKYRGIPAPPYEQVLLFDENEIIYLLENSDDEWLKGYKYSFKTKKYSDFYKQEGYFPKMCAEKIEKTNELSYFSWYLAGDRDLATKILNRLIPFTDSKSTFLVRSRAKVENSFAISFTHNSKVKHLKINQETLDSSFLKYDEQPANQTAYNCGYFATEPGVGTKNNNLLDGVSSFYSIDKRKFTSISDLVIFYSFNSLKECVRDFDAKLEYSFRDFFPKPKHTVIAKHDYAPAGENIQYQIEVVPNHKYFVLNDEDKCWYYVFDANGLLGYVPKACFVTSNE